MHVTEIGELTDRQTHWQLVYDQCGHDLEFARLGLDDPEQAVREVRRHYADCLTCRLNEQHSA
ncbi:MAG: hypothetical protein M3336_15305 [Chloroflexota bacterium]|nr:hypothetical protein [Chloroflexota bacterium]